MRAVLDLKSGTRVAGGKSEPLALPKGDVLALELDGGHRVMLRPSGTEPKIKFYFDVREPIAAGEEVARARARAEGRMAELSRAFVEIAGVT